MSHPFVDFEHLPQVFDGVTRHIGRTLGRNSTVHLRCHLPPFNYITDNATIVQFVASVWKVDCSDGDLKKSMAVLNDRSWDFLSVAKADLVKTLQDGIPGKSLKSNILKEARALFLCKCDQCFDKEPTRNTTEQFMVTPQFSTTGLTTFHTLPWAVSKLKIRTK